MTAPRYQIEHRDGYRVVVVGYILTQFEALTARLRAEGKHGELVIVEPATGKVFIRVSLAEPASRPVEDSP
jgi:hypothetical protein